MRFKEPVHYTSTINHCLLCTAKDSLLKTSEIFTMSQKNILITGANRGLGRGILEIFLAKPNHTIIAANRSPDNASSKELLKLPTGAGSKIVVVKYDAAKEESGREVVEELKSQGIDYLDVVIANAAIANAFPLVRDAKVADLEAHLKPNYYGVLWLYQATRELLLKGKNPQWVTMGSSAGKIEYELSSLGKPQTNKSVENNQRFRTQHMELPKLLCIG
jgi:NAD(P)-dependent dehydrogenase (short-subunit alcohol dehydrogenase family)